MSAVYEITNPSDAYTIVGELKVCQATVLVLGRGAFGLKDSAGETVLPVFLLGGADEWIAENFTGGLTAFEEYLHRNKEMIADCLDTVLIGSFARRLDFEAATSRMTSEDAASYAAEWRDRKRTSMCDIKATAVAMAEALRRREEDAEVEIPDCRPIVAVGPWRQRL